MTISFDFSVKTALVVGGTRGIGFAIAQALAAADADVHITGTAGGPEGYDADLSAFTYHQLRFEEPGGAQTLAAGFDGLDILVVNAGGTAPDEYDPANFDRALDLNLRAPAHVCMAFHRALANNNGAIVTIGSVASFLGIRDAPGYTAGKAGLLGLTRSLADQWARDGIRVNMVAPGFTRTDLVDRTMAQDRIDRIVPMIPARRFASPEEIAPVVLFLASEAASYVTGQSIIADGGFMIR